MDDQLPTLAVVAHYDSFGAAPVRLIWFTLLSWPTN